MSLLTCSSLWSGTCWSYRSWSSCWWQSQVSSPGSGLAAPYKIITNYYNQNSLFYSCEVPLLCNRDYLLKSVHFLPEPVDSKNENILYFKKSWLWLWICPNACVNCVWLPVWNMSDIDQSVPLQKTCTESGSKKGPDLYWLSLSSRSLTCIESPCRPVQKVPTCTECPSPKEP